MSSETEPTDTGNPNVIRGPHLKIPDPCLLPAWIDEFEELIVEGPKDLIVTNAPERNTLGCLKIRSGKRIKSEIPVSTLNPCPPSDTPVDKLSSLPMDIGALILANLFLEDIVNFSKVSKVQHHQTFNNEALWRIKFHQRWNCEHAGLLQSMHAVYSDIPPLSDHKSACNDDDGRGLEASRHISVQDPLEGGMNTFWKRCYQSAHSNPHDLWITHWNCVEPNDGVSSGRTVIPDLHLKPRRCVDLEKGPEEKYCSHKSNLHEGIMRQCPTCRHHPLLRERLEEIEHALNAELNYKESNGADTDSDPIFQTKCVAAAHQKLLEDSSQDKEIECITTPSRSIYSSTQYSLAKLSRRMDSVLNLDLQKPLHSSNASDKEGEGIGEFEFKNKLRERRNAVIQAFESASTFGRQLDCHQYRSSGLQFLTDTLFFPLDLSHERATFTSRDKMTNDEKVRTNPEVDTQVNLHQKSEEQSSCSYEFSETEHALFDLYGSPNFEMNIEYRPFDAFSDDSIVRPKDPGTLSSLGSKFETTQYSWHIIRLTNPDHVRPLSFRVFCQRSECFTAFPSQGYLRPGETCFITLGVSCLGGVMAKAVDEIDTMRDEVLPFLAEIYQREGDLPRTAFALRYIYAPCVPCVPIELQDFDGIVTNTESDDRNEQFGLESGITNRLWDNLRSEKEVRTIHLSAHVNGHYSLSEFQNRTMAPFELSQPLVKDMKARKNIVPPYVDRSVVAPNLEQSAPKTFSFLHDMALESDCSSIGISYRTEKSCMFCGRDWGARSEQLGRSFVLKKAVFEEHGRQHNRQMCNVYDALRSVTVLYNHSILNHDESENEYDARLLNRLYQLLLIIHTVLTKKRGCALSTERQKEVLKCYEIYEDQICLQLSRLLNKKTSEDNKIEIELLENHWRFSGIFKNPRCKNVDVFGNHESICLQRLFDPKFSLLKEEPGHLDEFRYKGHTPGLYQFGIPDDPNIPDGENNNQHTDLFHNKLFESLKSGIALVLDPKSLLTHGLYDFVPLPGTISRYYCRTDVSYFDVLNAIDNEKVKKTLSENIALWQEVALTRKKGKLLYFSDQKEAMFRLNDPDPDGYRLFTIGLRRSLSGGDNVLNSLFTYVNNIPSPGTGRYPLSKLQSDNPHVSINSIIVPYTPTDFNYGESSLEVKNEQQFISTGRGRHNLERRLPPFMLFGGLRLLNSFWYICEQVGWSIVDEDNPGLTMVNRRLLIATQVLSNSLVTFPLLLSLVARHISLISTHPIDHYLDGQSNTNKDMRYLSNDECGTVAFLVFFTWSLMGRYVEKNINRTYERAMIDQSALYEKQPASMLMRCLSLWDSICPFFLQKFSFAPSWNKRSERIIYKNMLRIRASDRREYSSSVSAEDVLQRGDRVLKTDSQLKLTTNIYAFMLVGGVSFSACSPHYILNLCTVFYGSVAMGLSMSLYYIEVFRAPHVTGLFAKFDHMPLHLVVTASILMGQLVGSSGGILFLAEFVVTAVGLILGGAATISTNAMESWLCFFCLSSTAFWGYVLSRVGLASSLHKKRGGSASFLLFLSILVFTALWITAIFVSKSSPLSELIIHHRSIIAPPLSKYVV